MRPIGENGIVSLQLWLAFVAARRMLESRRAQRGFNLVGGSLLGGAGLWALAARLR